MQTTTIYKNLISSSSARSLVHVKKTSHLKTVAAPMVHGMHKLIVKTGIWINIILLALYHFKNPVTASKAVKNLKKLRNDLRGKHPILKYAKTNGKYYFTSSAPGWPSVSFNKYVLNNIKRFDVSKNAVTLDTILFGITKKCGYQCKHCFEWDALNQPETLSRENLLSVIHSFQKAGITQVQLSGGEPLNRFDDILYILQNIKKGTEVWLYTSGYHFTSERAAELKQNGLTGITVSLDHWVPELHNIFRGKKNAFDWAEKAVGNARNEGLVVCLSICAIKDFITQKNLVQYAELAKQWGVSFIQVLEPKAVGHYNGKDVCLGEAQISLLEDFYVTYNYDKAYREYPSIVYHGFYSRRVGCGGGGKHYIYVDTDGDVHNCPFCQKKIFSALHDNIADNLRLMAAGGCNALIYSQKKQAYETLELFNSAFCAGYGCCRLHAWRLVEFSCARLLLCCFSGCKPFYAFIRKSCASTTFTFLFCLSPGCIYFCPRSYCINRMVCLFIRQHSHGYCFLYRACFIRGHSQWGIGLYTCT